MHPVKNLYRKFAKKIKENKRKFRLFLSRLEKNTPRKLQVLVRTTEQEVWDEVNCLSCANCCKKMTPTFTPQDLQRISAHLHMTVDAFKEKWLYKERKKDGDWMNRKQPCQFLDLKTNFCSIYEVRPVDCAGFPHFYKKFDDYVHVHKVNLEYCPATYTMVEKLRTKLEGKQ